MSIRKPRRRTMAIGGLAVAAVGGLVAATTLSSSAATPTVTADHSAYTSSPIKHVVVIFDENISYDHYFGTYPQAANTDGVKFKASKKTPFNNNLVTSGNLTSNPNEYPPSRLTPSEALTCDQNHNYGPEQKAFDSGKMDQFVQNVSVDSCTGEYGAPGLSMDYYDGNTVTGLWNYAQNYALSDNSYGSVFGPSTPGALNLISGQTHGFKEVDSVTGQQVATPGTYVLASPDPTTGIGTVINDPDPVDEQNFLISTINSIEKSSYWSNTAVIVAYDDSDGWYDHQSAPIDNSSHDATNDAAICANSTAPVAGGYQDRCGPGPRLPLMVISPYAKSNYIAHNETTQASITQFIEDNWRTGRLGDSSFDATAGSLDPMFNFWWPSSSQVILKKNGSVKSIQSSWHHS